MPAPDLEALEGRLGLRVGDKGLLRQAFTHSTYANEHPELGPHNERLEFVGDAVLNLLAARLVYERFREGNEGVLSRRRATVVRREALADIAKDLGLGEHLLLGEGQRRATADNARLLADVCEALAGAIYLDGGLAAAEQLFAPRLAEALGREGEGHDWKTELQELCHERELATPRYAVVAVSGPDHDRLYSCEVWVAGALAGSGEGRSKKVAEQNCARAALEKLGGRS
jgi:ribonuclease III